MSDEIKSEPWSYRLFSGLFELFLVSFFVVMPLLALAYISYWLKAGQWPNWSLLSFAPGLFPQEPWQWQGLYTIWLWFINALVFVPVLVVSGCCLLGSWYLAVANDRNI